MDKEEYVLTEEELIEAIDNYLKYSHLYEENMDNKKRRMLLKKSIEFYNVDIDYCDYLISETFDKSKVDGYINRIQMDKLLIKDIGNYLMMLPKEENKSLGLKGIFKGMKKIKK